ncbi:MAG TPA: MmcQ/YjbR family DNA-binding protein [Thermoanaerobaculia bacterium]|nr:MmcQ/YjbR family DNA-binding protein [Thermoanaerobaculia bacterium]
MLRKTASKKKSKPLRPYDQIADLIGSVKDLPPDASERTGEKFTEMLHEEARRKLEAEDWIDRVRKIALALPDTFEKLSHGEPTFFVKKRSFAMIDNNHHSSGHVAVWCNAPPGAQESLVAADPKYFFRPPYVGPSGWLGVRIDRGLAWTVIADLLKQAHATSSAPKKSRL